LVPVYEFRHLTFQEYLAGLALVRGHFPGHDKTKRLAERIAPLAGITVEKNREFVVSENWREALRLCIASCNDDDVDEAIEAILIPLPTEDAEKTTRPRAVLAALCLADEPNVSGETGNEILKIFVKQADGRDGGEDSLIDKAITSLVSSDWSEQLEVAFKQEFDERTIGSRKNIDGIYAKVVGERALLHFSVEHVETLIREQLREIGSEEENRLIKACHTLAEVAYKQIFPDKLLNETLDTILAHFPKRIDFFRIESLALLLRDLSGNNLNLLINWEQNAENVFLQYLIANGIELNESVTTDIINFLADVKSSCSNAIEFIINKLDDEDKDVRRAAYRALGEIKDVRAVEPLIAKLDDEDKDVRSAACRVLGEIKDVRAVEPLIAKLDDEDKGVRQQALGALAKITRDETDQKLLSEYFDARYFWLDPKEPIAHARIAKAAEKLKLPPEEIQCRYEVLAQQFGLILEWKQ